MNRFYPIAFTAMGSPCQIQLRAASPASARDLAKPLIDEVHRFERHYSRYRSDNWVARVNRGEPCELDAEAAQLIDYAAQLFHESCGRFDITAGVLREAWDFSKPRVPVPEQLESLRQRVGWPKVSWCRPRLHLPQGMQIDLGGVVKEYAADAVAALAVSLGLNEGLVELGGDIRIIGEGDWPLGVSDPRQPQQALFRLRVQRGGFATSGNYQRSFWLDGVCYSHILDPTTGWPVVTPASVSVLADSCLLAGSASTLAMLAGEAACLDWLDDLGLPYFCVFNDGRQVNRF